MSIVTDLVETIQQAFGEESAMLLGSKPRKIPVISTGVPQVDVALGVGGLPRGRIIEIYGPESSGKTTLALHCAAKAQKYGAICYIDAEHSLDPKYAKAIGLDVDNVILNQPASGEEGLKVLEVAIASGDCSMGIVDSVAGLTPEAELRGEIGDAHIGRQARLMSQALRILTSQAAKNKTIIIFINQLRDKIGVSWGSPEVTPGGRALKFYASVRIDIRRTGSEEDGKEKIANKTKITIKKNKVAPPFKIVEATLVFGKGFSLAHNFLPTALKLGIMKKKKSTYYLKDEKLGVKKKAIAALQEYDEDDLLAMLNPSRKEKLQKKIEKLQLTWVEFDEDSEDREKVAKRIKKLKKRLKKIEQKED